MRWPAGIAMLFVAAAAVTAYLLLDPFADDSNRGAGRAGTGTTTAEPAVAGSACDRLAALAGRLAAENDDPLEFLVALGRDAAGIRAGRGGLADLARGGNDRIPGRGFQTRFDDGSRGQVRHFAGVARATIYGGASPTRWISEQLRDDPADSPDGRLSEQAIDFATALIDGELALGETESWIERTLCRQSAGSRG